MDWADIDWTALARLRELFLTGTGGAADYWRTERDLKSYDLTFAQRIGWKWDFVLAELARLGWTPPSTTILDWGCGSGIAGRAYLTHFLATDLEVWDRSNLAMRFAAQRARDRFPSVTVRTGRSAVSPILLLSHVLTELTEPQLDDVVALCGSAAAVIWVEPGTHGASRRLIQVRDRLRNTFRVIAPCPHPHPCGMLATGNERHWCHFFAPSPPGVYRDGNWARFAQLAEVDLRSLPVSYLVADRQALVGAPQIREIGRPRLYKAHAQVLRCDASGVRDVEIRQRDEPGEFRRLKKKNP